MTPTIQGVQIMRPLNSTQRIKPLDCGERGLAASISPQGRIICAGAYHPVHGWFVLSSAPPFDESKRYQPDVVRAYRRGLASEEGFGLAFDQPVEKQAAWLAEDALPVIALTLADGTETQCLSFVPVDGPPRLIQRWRFSRPTAPRVTGRVWLQRAAYTQLTEGGPAPMPGIRTRILVNEGGLLIHNSEMGGAALIQGLGHASESRDDSIRFDQTLDAVETLDICVYLGTDPYALTAIPYHDIDVVQMTTLERWQARWANWTQAGSSLAGLKRRGISYTHLCAVPVDDEAVCILTDHMLLPLSWNRDSYYSALALLRQHDDERLRMVRGHLIWLFERAERPDGHWARSYFANGRVKDPAYQLDQQIFPLLELADYLRVSGDLDILDRLGPRLVETFDALMARRDDPRWLFPTDETPGDDPIHLPYHFSSHVLLWHTLRQVGPYLPERELAGMVDALRREIDVSFIAMHAGQRLYAYASDGAGQYHLYHDANDTPLALMPAWGFCEADNPVWRATADFAFSEANDGGFYGGRLGSVHTRAAWPLGDGQEWLIAQATGDDPRRERAEGHLNQAARWDGALPEACDPISGETISRHWFAWPNALVAALID